MAIRTDYVAGEVRTAAQVNEENQQILDNETDITNQGWVDDTAYGISWNGDTTTSPSKNAVYDKMETKVSGNGTHTDFTHNVTHTATSDGFVFLSVYNSDNVYTTVHSLSIDSEVVGYATSARSNAASDGSICYPIKNGQTYITKTVSSNGGVYSKRRFIPFSY